MAQGTKPKLILIDGHSLLYRGFFATRLLTTSDGRPTNAVYSFTNMLLSLLESEQPDALVVAFDAPAKTFRHEEFVEYKAHRRETPVEFSPQVAMAKALVEAFGIPVVEVPGFEADDVVGTLARRGAEQGYEVLVVTGDMDMLQLVNDQIHVRATVRGVIDLFTYDPKSVEERYGLRPDQIPDFKALKGDPSDNIPGVPGVGEKTALKLLQEFEHVETLAENPERVEDPKLRERLMTYRAEMLQSKRLATIVQDVPLESPIVHFQLDAKRLQQLQEVLEDLEFRSILRRLPALARKYGEGTELPVASVREALDAQVVQNPDERVVGEALAGAKVLSLRVVGNGGPLRSVRPRQIALSTRPGRSYLVPLEKVLFVPPALQAALEDPHLPKLTYDAKRDLMMLRQIGIEGQGFTFDAMLAAYLLQPTRSSYPLHWMIEEFLEASLPEQERERPAYEIVALLRLQPLMEAKLKQEGTDRVFREIEMPLVPVLADMEWVGIRIDSDYLQELSARLAIDLGQLAEAIYQLAGEEFNLGSPKQLGYILFEKLKLPVIKKTKTGYSTDVEVLQALSEQYEIAREIVRYRELSKLRSTYAEALPKLVNPDTGRLHTTYNQTVTATGRLSSSEPNLQNIPIRSDTGRKIRRAFIADPGSQLLSLDYSQIELRILAHMSGDAALLDAFAQGRDIHATTASLLFDTPPEGVTSEMRRKAKTVNFAVLYGMSDYGLSQELGVPVATAKQIITDYFNRFPKVKAFTQGILEEARRKGYVTTLLGRRRYMPELESANRNERMAAERAAINTPFQGTAADIMKLAMIHVWEYLRQSAPKTRMLLQVHDELVLESQTEEVQQVVDEIASRMERAYQLKVPLTVERKAGPNWRDMEAV